MLSRATKKLTGAIPSSSQVQMDAAEDFRADAQLHEACKEDADKLCKGVPTGGGRVQGCLVRETVSYHCWLLLRDQPLRLATNPIRSSRARSVTSACS